MRPESGTVVPGWKDDAVIQFDEVIDEMAAGGGGGGAGAAGGGGLARQVLLSPVAGDVHVAWGRTRIRVKPKEGWRDGRIYRLELLPGIIDLRRNKLVKGQVVLFSTGPAIGHATLTGTALQWVEQRTLLGALIEAVPLPDSVGYVALADSGGKFRLDGLHAGRYVVYATADENTNRRRDQREAYDSALVKLDSSATVTVFTFVHDTAGPRLRNATAVDSFTVRLEFSQALAATAPLDTARVRVVQLPDSTPVPLAAVLTPPQYDSLAAAARAKADSAAKPDTTRGAGGAVTPPPSRPAGVRAAAARGDTAEIRRLLALRPVPFDRAVLRFGRPLAPETRYLIRVTAVQNLNGAVADGQIVLVTPKPPPPPAPRDTSRAPRPKPPLR